LLVWWRPFVNKPVVSEAAPAKLNLFLRVLSRRPDGFHEIETLLQPLTLADGVQATSPARGIELQVAGKHSDDVPAEGENLVVRAARGIAEAAKVSTGARLLLVKRIPVAAGLGGGSSDAAATLRALDRLWDSGLGKDELLEIAANVGSDVPAQLSGVPVLARGRGEKVTPLPQMMRSWWVLVSPSFPVHAAEAYGWWDEDGGPVGADPRPLLETVTADDPSAVGPLLFNDLEDPVSRRHPQIAAAREALLRAGTVGAVMCGSGPTVAGLARDASHAENIATVVGGTVVAGIVGIHRIG
jgi:4-diphosphocytidyl-2-C-methyl-D-erythritol kinase